MSSFLHVFGMPIILAVFSGIGLVAALLSDDLGDVVSWLTLGALVLVIAWYWIRPARR